MALGLIQGALGQPFASAVEGPAFAILNEMLGAYHTDGGFARPARYEVILQMPSGQGGSRNPNVNPMAQQAAMMRNDNTARHTSMKCEQFSFPGRNLDTSPDDSLYGPTREVVNGWSYGDVTGQFQCSSDMKEKRFFETWQRLAYDPQSWNIGYYYDYVGKIQVYQLDEKDQRKYGVELIECFPKTIAAQTLDYGAQNQQQKVSVTFSYRYWKSLTDEADLPRPLQDRIANILQNTVERRLQAAIPAVLQRL